MTIALGSFLGFVCAFASSAVSDILVNGTNAEKGCATRPTAHSSERHQWASNSYPNHSLVNGTNA